MKNAQFSHSLIHSSQRTLILHEPWSPPSISMFIQQSGISIGLARTSIMMSVTADAMIRTCNALHLSMTKMLPCHQAPQQPLRKRPHVLPACWSCWTWWLARISAHLDQVPWSWYLHSLIFIFYAIQDMSNSTTKSREMTNPAWFDFPYLVFDLARHWDLMGLRLRSTLTLLLTFTHTQSFTQQFSSNMFSNLPPCFLHSIHARCTLVQRFLAWETCSESSSRPSHTSRNHLWFLLQHSTKTPIMMRQVNQNTIQNWNGNHSDVITQWIAWQAMTCAQKWDETARRSGKITKILIKSKIIIINSQKQNPRFILQFVGNGKEQ